jgi:hydroxymethylpyrimidine pyrophosphatase-like HAD family hydrolase
MEIRPKTIFCDIDGTLVEHATPWESSFPSFKMKILPGTLEKLAEWDRKGYNIILTTGRRESLRKVTEQQLSEVGIFYDQLIMGIGGGARILINDLKPNSDITATSINLNRNQGISNLEI